MNKNIILVVLLVCFLQKMHSQNVIKRLPNHKLAEVHTVFINGALGSFKMIGGLDISDINDFSIIDSNEDKINEIPNNYKTTHPKIDTSTTDLVTQKEINEKYNLSPENNIYFDGYLIENKNYQIYKEAIVEIEIIKPDSLNKLKNKVLNIWTLEKHTRHLNPIRKNQCATGRAMSRRGIKK